MHVSDAKLYEEKHENIHIIHYESLIENPRDVLVGLAKFINKELSDEELNLILQYTLFENMKKNPLVNKKYTKIRGDLDKDGRFLRNGKIGDWLNHFDPKISELFDEKIGNQLKNTNIKFNYGIGKKEAKLFFERKRLLSE